MYVLTIMKDIAVVTCSLLHHKYCCKKNFIFINIIHEMHWEM